MTTYEVKANGSVQSTHKTEAAAIKAAQTYPEEAGARVFMHEVSGTYHSHTCIWPSVGATYSN